MVTEMPSSSKATRFSPRPDYTGPSAGHWPNSLEVKTAAKPLLRPELRISLACTDHHGQNARRTLSVQPIGLTLWMLPCLLVQKPQSPCPCSTSPASSALTSDKLLPTSSPNTCSFYGRGGGVLQGARQACVAYKNKVAY